MCIRDRDFIGGGSAVDGVFDTSDGEGVEDHRCVVSTAREAVSYTHLDVYKRQGLSSSAAVGCAMALAVDELWGLGLAGTDAGLSLIHI